LWTSAQENRIDHPHTMSKRFGLPSLLVLAKFDQAVLSSTRARTMMGDRGRERMKRRAAATGAAVLGGAAAYLLVGRRWQLGWGATGEEHNATLAGDDLIATSDLVATRAITVHAPADQVFPWIAQLGQGRGGFYSYDALENLVGCDIHSADRVVPEWQDLKVGDQVKLHPEVELAVAVVEPGRALVLRGGVPMGEVAPPYDFTWAFVLREQPAGATRLLVRERYAYTKRWAPLLVEPVAAVAFVMSQRMLRGIRDRAERGGQSTA
jgi:hypothetical protein